MLLKGMCVCSLTLTLVQCIFEFDNKKKEIWNAPEKFYFINKHNKHVHKESCEIPRCLKVPFGTWKERKSVTQDYTWKKFYFYRKYHSGQTIPL